MSETPPPSTSSSSPSSPPPDQNEPATGPVFAPPPPYTEQAAPYAPPSSAQSSMPPHTVYVERSSRLTKVAAWVGIVAGSLFIVVVIFGAGFFTGKAAGGHRDHDRGHEMMMRPGPAMFPMGPPGGIQRGPAFPGPFGPGQIIEIPRPPGGSSDTPTEPRP